MKGRGKKKDNEGERRKGKRKGRREKTKTSGTGRLHLAKFHPHWCNVSTPLFVKNFKIAH